MNSKYRQFEHPWLAKKLNIAKRPDSSWFCTMETELIADQQNKNDSLEWKGARSGRDGTGIFLFIYLYICTHFWLFTFGFYNPFVLNAHIYPPFHPSHSFPLFSDLEDKMASFSSRFDFREGSDLKLGTMMGVFIPTLQNILGIILFLRLPWITGQAGIAQTIVIVLLGCSASMITSISMSAIATNGVPKGGGAYSVIKESIGPEFGGTVGCLLFLSNTFGYMFLYLNCI